jgi:hypothetical protein
MDIPTYNPYKHYNPYNPSTVSGESWQRACSVHIDNPSDGLPSLNIIEQRVILLSDGRKIYEPVGNLTAEYDAENPLHGQLYSLLNDIYVEFRTARDNPPPEPVL